MNKMQQWPDDFQFKYRTQKSAALLSACKYMVLFVCVCVRPCPSVSAMEEFQVIVHTLPAPTSGTYSILRLTLIGSEGGETPPISVNAGANQHHLLPGTVSSFCLPCSPLSFSRSPSLSCSPLPFRSFSSFSLSPLSLCQYINLQFVLSNKTLFHFR